MEYLTYGEILKKSSKAKEALKGVKKEKDLFKKTKITPDLFIPKSKSKSKPTSKFGKLKAYLNPYPKLSKKFSKLVKENYHYIYDETICELEIIIYILDGAFYDFKKQLGEKYKEILNSYRNYKKIVVFLQESAESCNDKPNINAALVNNIISKNLERYEFAIGFTDLVTAIFYMECIFINIENGSYNSEKDYEYLEKEILGFKRKISKRKKELSDIKEYVKKLAKQCEEELNKSKN